MAKYIAVAAVVALAVGIIIGVNSNPDSTPWVGQALSNAIPASADVSLLDETGLGRITNAERIDAEIGVLNLLADAIADQDATLSEREEKYEALISEITRLTTIRDTLQGEIEAVQLISR